MCQGPLKAPLPDTIIRQKKRSVPDRKPGQVTDRKTNDSSEIDSADLVTGRQGVTQPMKLTHMMQKKTQTPKRKSRARTSQT